jgi:hypothetical protein
MKLALNPFRYPVQPVALNVAHTGAASRPEEPPQQHAVPSPPPVSPARNVSVDLEYRAHIFQQHNFPNDQITSRSQQAVRAYNALTEIEERARVSELFGLSEYA